MSDPAGQANDAAYAAGLVDGEKDARHLIAEQIRRYAERFDPSGPVRVALLHAADIAAGVA